MFSSVRYFLADVFHWLRSHTLIVGLLVLVIAAAAAAVVYVVTEDDSGAGRIVEAPAPQVVIPETPEPEQPTDLGFPTFATKNTTRVAGADPTADAAAVALAVHPSTGGVPRPGAVTLVDRDDWPGGLAAASLVASPVGAPILLTDGEDIPDLTAEAIRSLAPAGDQDTDGRQLFVVGDAAKPDGFDAAEASGSTPAEVAASIDQLRTKLAGEPEHILVTTDDDPAIAMPAAGWSARSGDPILYVEPDAVPEATSKALAKHNDVPVYVLGAESAIEDKVIKELERTASSVERIGADDPVDNAIEFARFASGSFGWNINDPGHGFVIANASRPLDAAAAAPLSASGTWGPLLLTEDAATLPGPLRGYLLDLKPGYDDDPTRAVYNHIWIVGDPDAVSVDVQAQVDELAEVAPVRSGSGTSVLGPPPGSVEPQPDQAGDDSGPGGSSGDEPDGGQQGDQNR